MAETIADALSEVADLDSGSSGLVEKLPLETLANTLITILLNRGVHHVDDAAALALVDPAEATKVLALDSGLYIYDADASAGGSNIAAIGGGYWVRSETASMSSLLDVLLTNPTDGQVPIYNESTGKWENGNQSVANIGYANVSGKPDQLLDLSPADLLVKKFGLDAGGLENIGTQAHAASDGVIMLCPKTHGPVEGSNSTIICQDAIDDLGVIVDSYILTNRTNLRGAAGDPMNVVNSIIIGDPGPLSGYANFADPDTIEDCIIIGLNGAPIFVYDANSGAAESVITGPSIVRIDAPTLQAVAGIFSGNLSTDAQLDANKIEVATTIKATQGFIPGRYPTGTLPVPAANTNPILFDTTLGKHVGWDGAAWNALY